MQGKTECKNSERAVFNEGLCLDKLFNFMFNSAFDYLFHFPLVFCNAE